MITSNSLCSLLIDSVLANLHTQYNLFVTWKPVFMALWSVMDMHKMVKIWVAWLTSSPLWSNSHLLLPCFSSHPVNKYSFHSLFKAPYFTILCILLVIPVSKWPSSVVLRCCLVPLSARSLWWALQTKYIYYMFHSGINYGAVACARLKKSKQTTWHSWRCLCVCVCLGVHAYI